MCLWPSCYSWLSLVCPVGTLRVTSGPVERKAVPLAPSRSCCTCSRRLVDLPFIDPSCPSRRITIPTASPKPPRQALSPAATAFSLVLPLAPSSPISGPTTRATTTMARELSLRAALGAKPTRPKQTYPLGNKMNLKLSAFCRRTCAQKKLVAVHHAARVPLGPSQAVRVLR